MMKLCNTCFLLVAIQAAFGRLSFTDSRFRGLQTYMGQWDKWTIDHCRGKSSRSFLFKLVLVARVYHLWWSKILEFLEVEAEVLMLSWLVLNIMLDFVYVLGRNSQPLLRNKDFAVSGIFQTDLLGLKFCTVGGMFWGLLPLYRFLYCGFNSTCVFEMVGYNMRKLPKEKYICA